MRVGFFTIVATMLGGCSVLDTDVQRNYAVTPDWNTKAAFTTASVRIMTDRVHPKLGGSVLCTEPSPDVAVALATALALKASGGNGGATGSLEGSGSSAEAVAELAGRSTALLALRDGLFRSCEAYANGIIGQDSYGLILSRYGQLMTTLFLGQDLSSAAATENKVSAATTGSEQDTTTPAKTGAGMGSKPAANTIVAPGANPSLVPTVVLADSRSLLPAGVLSAATADPAAPGGAGGKTTATTDPAMVKGQVSASDAATAALTIGRMNEDYLHLGGLGAVIIACINNADQTRFRPGFHDQYGIDASNRWLDTICPQISLATLEQLEPQQWPPINPAVTASMQAGGGARQASTKKSDPVVLAVQQALKRQNLNPGDLDGIDGARTREAVAAFQKAHGLPVNGNYTDPNVQAMLGVNGRV